MTMTPIPPGGLPALADAVKRDLDLLDYSGPGWTRPQA
jgi:hypothetical protein